MPPITPPPAFSLSFLHRYPLEATQHMARYLRDRRCRWVVLLEAFGFGSAAKPCRKCDRCRRN